MSQFAVQQAESAAHDYVREMPHASPAARTFAYEDYVAGYLAAESKPLRDLQFVIEQLQQLHDLASRESEFYSLAVVRYTLQMLGALK